MAKNVFANNTATSYVTNVNNAALCKEEAEIYFFTVDTKEELDKETGELEKVPKRLNIYVRTASGRKYLWTRHVDTPASFDGTRLYLEAILGREARQIFASANSIEEVLTATLEKTFIFEIGKGQKVSIKTERTESHAKIIHDLV